MVNSIKAYILLSKSLNKKSDKLVKFKEPESYYTLTKKVLKSNIIPIFLKKKIINKSLEIAYKGDFVKKVEIYENLYALIFSRKNLWMNRVILNSRYRDERKDRLVLWDIKKKSESGKLLKLVGRVKALIELHRIMLNHKNKKVRRWANELYNNINEELSNELLNPAFTSLPFLF